MIFNFNGSGGGNPDIKISDDKAWVQLWDGNEWVNWKQTGLTDFDLLQTLPEDWSFTWSVANGSALEINEFLISETQWYSKIKGTGAGYKGTYERYIPIDNIDKYNYLSIKGLLSCSIHESGVLCKFMARNRLTQEEVLLKEYRFETETTKSHNVDLILDISSLNGQYDIIVTGTAWVQITSTVNLSKIRLHN